MFDQSDLPWREITPARKTFVRGRDTPSSVKLRSRPGRYFAPALLAFACACKTEPVDPESERCKAERASIVAIFASSTRCAKDSDCKLLFTDCSLPGDCGGVAVATTAAPALEARSKAFFDAGCAAKVRTPSEECPDLYDRRMMGRCETKGPAFCSRGTCQAARPWTPGPPSVPSR